MYHKLRRHVPDVRRLRVRPTGVTSSPRAGSPETTLAMTRRENFGRPRTTQRNFAVVAALVVVVSGLGTIGFELHVVSPPAAVSVQSVGTPAEIATFTRSTAGHALAATAWARLRPAASLANCDRLQMGYDPKLAELVLFGGHDPILAPYGDTWVLHAGSWTELTSPLKVAPTARWAAPVAYVPAVGGMVLFGGRKSTSSSTTPGSWTAPRGSRRRAVRPLASSRDRDDLRSGRPITRAVWRWRRQHPSGERLRLGLRQRPLDVQPRYLDEPYPLVRN
jgi:hypothetical protein